jgi:hypothetical protein
MNPTAKEVPLPSHTPISYEGLPTRESKTCFFGSLKNISFLGAGLARNTQYGNCYSEAWCIKESEYCPAGWWAQTKRRNRFLKTI